jgi:hypothetical protein
MELTNILSVSYLLRNIYALWNVCRATSASYLKQLFCVATDYLVTIVADPLHFSTDTDPGIRTSG